MHPEITQIRIGFTQSHPCSYLEDQQERVAIALDSELQNAYGYELLLANGFRRSGDTLYRPHCENCYKCIAIRIDVQNFTPSKSQKRLLNKGKQLIWKIDQEIDENWFELYSRYITTRHKNGSMYPPNQDNFYKFIQTTAIPSSYLHVYDDNKLVSVAITDQVQNANSAFYTFFEPDFPFSLGTLSVLYQIELTQQQRKKWLYLGYQIDECPAMNYKVRFDSHQRLVNHRWQR